MLFHLKIHITFIFSVFLEGCDVNKIIISLIILLTLMTILYILIDI